VPARGLWWRFRAFLVVGVAATLAQYVILVVLVELRDWPATVASSTGFAIAAVGNYLLNYYVTFASRAPHSQAAGRFALVALAGLLLNTLAMFLLERRAGVHYLLAQIVATGLTLVWTFAASQWWAFRAPAGGAGS
jgi:putative flippase GtrA